MHDTDRILAELSMLDGSELEGEGGEELEDAGELEDLENFEEMEFEAESGFDELVGEGETFEAEQLEGADFEGADFESADYESADFESADFESADYEGAPYAAAAPPSSPLGEVDEMELAAELLEVQDEGELEYFLSALIGKVAKGLGSALASPLGRQLTGILKDAAKKALPIAGTALGTAIGGPAGAAIASDLTSRAGQLFGLELEGLTPEDREFEAARSFVRFAADAAQEAEASGPAPDPTAAARAAFAAAAARFAPGLLATGAFGPGMVVRRRRRRGVTGRWVRVSPNQILLYGL